MAFERRQQQQRQPGQQRDGDDARAQGQARIATGVAPAQQGQEQTALAE